MIVYAVNVHTGGGKVLLDELLSGRPFGPITALFHDQRYVLPAGLPTSFKAYAVKNTLFSRLAAEFKLKSFFKDRPEQPVLFFGNLPPIFFKPLKAILYLQNCFLLPGIAAPSHQLKTRLRLLVEKLILKYFIHNIDEIWVQTGWMAEGVAKIISRQKVSIKPFLPKMPLRQAKNKIYDFITITSLAKHKNFNLFIKALELLDKKLKNKISVLAVLDSKDTFKETLQFSNIILKVENDLNREELFNFYAQSRVAVITSSFESFCLPLHEALHFDLNVISLNAPYAQISSSKVTLFDGEIAENLAQVMLGESLKPPDAMHW